MENTTEEKERFFANYWGQQVLFHANSRPELVEFEFLIAMSESVEYYCALLADLSGITEEHAFNIGKILASRDEITEISGINYTELGKKYCRNYHKPCSLSTSMHIMHGRGGARVADYARKHGYAIEFDGISVEEQIKRGWVKIKKS